MKSYFSKDGITIYHGSCLKVLPKLKTVDLVLTDPPYGVAYKSKTGIVMAGDYPDLSSEMLGKALPLFRKLLKDGGAVFIFTSWKLLSAWLQRFEKHFKIINLLIWEKEGSSGLYTGSNFGYCYEMVFFGSKGTHKLLEPEFDVLGFRREAPKSKRHPTQKPSDLIKRLISISCPVGSTVLDPFMGSGTTLVAAKQANCKAIGIDIEEKYCEVAAKRVEDTIRLEGMSFQLDKKQRTSLNL